MVLIDVQGILSMTCETIVVTLIATVFAYLIGLPLGIILNVTKKNGLKPNRFINFSLSLFVNILRSIPCLIIIVILLPVTRKLLGKGTGEWYTILLPLVVASFGMTTRMVEQSLSEVPVGEIEAVKSLGATNFQIIKKVMLAEALPSLISGVAVVAVSILGYTSFAYNISAGGLISGIYSIYYGNSGDYMSNSMFWILIVVTIILVQLIQELGIFISKKIDKRRILK